MLWGAFNNASQAMMATSWDMGSISQNIANVNTVGYKRKETMFKTVLSESKAGMGAEGLNVFTAKAVDRMHITNQGTISTTNNGNDLAISGRGFFMVSPPVAAGAPTTVDLTDTNSVLYTRAGQFEPVAGPDDQRYLTIGGNYLMGWAIDPVTGLPGTTLEPVHTLPQTVMDGRATTSATLNANLPAGGVLGPTGYTADITGQVDGAGNPVDFEMVWTRVDGQTWTVTPNFPGGEGSSPTSITVTRNPLTGAVTHTPDPATIDVNWNAGFGGNTTTLTLGTLSGPSSNDMSKIYLPVVDANYDTNNVTLAFERVGPNNWYMHVDGASSVPIQFSEDGQMLTASPLTVDASFTSGTPPVTTTQSITVDIENMTQYDGPLYLGTISQDGYETGQLMRTNWTPQGDLMGYFSNGETLGLYRIPVATFVAENSLEAVSGTLFRRTAAAGDLTVSALGDTPGGGSWLNANSVETSTVDIEDEFTKMIMTQKAYSTNATVFRTADEMTTTVRDLKS